MTKTTKELKRDVLRVFFEHRGLHLTDMEIDELAAENDEGLNLMFTGLNICLSMSLQKRNLSKN